MIKKISSIKTFLLWWILGILTLSSAFVMTVSFLTGKHEVEELFDAELVNTAKFVVMTQNKFNLDYVPDSLNSPNNASTSTYKAPKFHSYEDKVSIQLYDKDFSLVLKSDRAPNFSLEYIEEGFFHLKQDGRFWHLFAIYNPKLEQWVVTAQDEHIRQELVGAISMQLLTPFLFGSPILLLFIWYILNRGLSPLLELAISIKSRNPSHLLPIKLGDMPQEISPIVTAINRLMEKLSATIEREKQITSDAAHELKTPLATIRLHAQNASYATNMQECKESLADLLNSVEKSTHLVEQLLKLARLEPLEEATLNTNMLDVGQLLLSICAQSYPFYLEKQLEVDVDVDENINILSSQLLLTTIFNNLIDNAINYTPEKGWIRISLKQQQRRTCFSVNNSGKKITQQEKERIFERFYRISPGETKGSGLGLSIVKRCAEVLKAQVNLPECEQGFSIEVLF